MRVFVTKVFARFTRKELIGDNMFCQTVKDADAHVDADLGGGVIKQRIARPHQGKSGGYRTIIFFRKGELAFFVYGFPKNDLANISRTQLAAFKKLAPYFLNGSEATIEDMIRDAKIAEVPCNGEDKYNLPR